MLSVEQHLDIFESGRPAMSENNKDLLQLGVLLEGEFNEFIPAWLDYIIHPSQETGQEVGQEAADVALYLAQCLRCIGSSLEVEMRDKIAYNTTRFTSQDFSGDNEYSEAYKRSKQWVRDTNWKQTYYAQEHVVYTT